MVFRIAAAVPVAAPVAATGRVAATGPGAATSVRVAAATSVRVAHTCVDPANGQACDAPSSALSFLETFPPRRSA